MTANDTTESAAAANAGGQGAAGDDSWKFRKLGAGVSPTDYRETLSREGLLDYLKEREQKFDEIYQQEYDKRTALQAENTRLQTALAEAQARADGLREADTMSQVFNIMENIGYEWTIKRSPPHNIGIGYAGEWEIETFVFCKVSDPDLNVAIDRILHTYACEIKHQLSSSAYDVTDEQKAWLKLYLSDRKSARKALEAPTTGGSGEG